MKERDISHDASNNAQSTESVPSLGQCARDTHEQSVASDSPEDQKHLIEELREDLRRRK